jgi:selenoprotein W-related protein
MSEIKRPVISLSYCTQCNWLLRTAWMAQELLSTFGQDIASVSLIPATGGLFQITLDGEVIWDRKEKGGFPDVKVLKKMVRDRVWPERDLGHIDRAGKTEG